MFNQFLIRCNSSTCKRRYSCFSVLAVLSLPSLFWLLLCWTIPCDNSSSSFHITWYRPRTGSERSCFLKGEWNARQREIFVWLNWSVDLFCAIYCTLYITAVTNILYNTSCVFSQNLNKCFLPGWGLSQMLVWRGFAVTLGWNTFFIILATVILKLRTWQPRDYYSCRGDRWGPQVNKPVGLFRLWIDWCKEEMKVFCKLDTEGPSLHKSIVPRLLLMSVQVHINV